MIHVDIGNLHHCKPNKVFRTNKCCCRILDMNPWLIWVRYVTYSQSLTSVVELGEVLDPFEMIHRVGIVVGEDAKNGRFVLICVSSQFSINNEEGFMLHLRWAVAF